MPKATGMRNASSEPRGKPQLGLAAQMQCRPTGPPSTPNQMQSPGTDSDIHRGSQWTGTWLTLGKLRLEGRKAVLEHADE